VNVLILHQYFNTPRTGGPLRSYYLAQALKLHGHNVTVITTSKSPALRRESVEGIDVHYLPIPYDNKYGFYQRGVAFIRYAIGAYRIASKLATIDICYTISVPLTVGISALWLKAFRGTQYIFEVGDLWPDAPVELGFVKNPLLKFFLFRLEKTIYRNAKSIVALSEPIRSRIASKAPGKIIDVIPNMADIEYFVPQAKPAVTFGTSSPFVVSYIGAVGFANGLDHLIECARACLKAALPVRFVICGDGAFVESLKTVKTRLNIDNLSFVEFQSREGVRKLLDETDAVFVSYRPFQILETGSPNKYFDGLAAGKLIIVNFGGWIRQEIEHNACGIYVNRQRPEEIVNSITPFLNDPSRLRTCQTNARALAVHTYSRQILGQKYIKIIENNSGAPC
jgi:glycosyltransferase involved in cell wall biosynthesis